MPTTFKKRLNLTERKSRQPNSQLERSSSELIINEKADSLTRDQDNHEFRVNQDTSTYSSLAVTRNNKLYEHNNINNNLDNAHNLSSSTESLADYEGELYPTYISCTAGMAVDCICLRCDVKYRRLSGKDWVY